MPRLHLAVLTTRNETWRLWKQLSKFPHHKQKIARAWQQESTFLQAFCLVSGCQTCMCKRGIS